MQATDIETGEVIKLEARDEMPRFPQKPQQATGLRKRGQNASTCSSSSGSQGDHTSWRATHSRSVASAQSEQSLGILDYYLDPPNSNEPVENAKRSLFSGRAKASSAPLPLPPVPPSRRSTESEQAQRTSREHIFRMLNKPTASKGKRTGQLWSKHDRRRSSLSICCQGQVYEEPMPLSSTCWPVEEQDGSPDKRKCSIQSSSGRSRKDSGASFAQTSPIDSRHTATSWTTKGSYRYSSELDHHQHKVSSTWSASEATATGPASKLSALLQPCQQQTAATPPKARRKLLSRLRSIMLCS